MIIYCTDGCPDGSGSLMFYTGSSWNDMGMCTTPATGGSGLAADWDQDGVPNSVDIDDDNGGILDTEETISFASAVGINGFNISGLVLETGVDKTVGAIYRESGIFTNVDLLVEIIEITNVSIDDTSQNTDRFNPKLSHNGSFGTEGYVVWEFRFVHAGTNNLVNINSLFITSIDVDGSNTRTEYQIVHSDSVEVVSSGANSDVDITEIPNVGYRFESNGSGQSGIGMGETFMVTAYFEKLTTIRFTTGVNNFNSSSTSSRAFSISFKPNILTNYTTPTTVSGFNSLNRDTDGDGIYDQYDTDSDGDGCGDAFEAGNSGNSNPFFRYPATNVGANGLDNSLETSDDSGTLSSANNIIAPYDDSQHTCN